MKTCRGSRGTAPLTLTSSLDGDEWKIYAQAALPPRKKPGMN